MESTGDNDYITLVMRTTNCPLNLLRYQRLTNCKNSNLGGIQVLNDWADGIDGMCNHVKGVSVLGKNRQQRF